MTARPTRIAIAPLCLVAALLTGCDTPKPGQRNDRDNMTHANVTINGHTFNVAVARTREEQRLGLMNVPANELGQDEGMLFVFPTAQNLSFWMKNTPTPLDIAFVDDALEIVRIHTMKPLDTSRHTSGRPARYALEVHAGRLAALGIKEGHAVQIGKPVLKP